MGREIIFPLLIPILFCFLSLAEATTYRCFDKSGTMVLTDSPAQLEACTVFDPQKPNRQTVNPPPRKFHHNPSRSRPPHKRFTPPEQDQAGEILSPSDQFSEEPSQKKASEPSAEAITVPITKIGGSMIVQVLLNNSVDAHLIVDTGATMTVLSYDLGIELGLLSGSEVSLNTVNTAGGSVQVSMTKVDSIQVGSAKASQVAVAIHDLPDAIPGISGLLGMSFLKHFEVTLDADRGFLRLLPKTQK